MLPVLVARIGTILPMKKNIGPNPVYCKLSVHSGVVIVSTRAANR